MTSNDLSKLLGVDIPENCHVELTITNEDDQELSLDDLAAISGGGMRNFHKSMKIQFSKGISSSFAVRNNLKAGFDVLCWH